MGLAFKFPCKSLEKVQCNMQSLGKYDKRGHDIAQKEDADAAYNQITSFEFVFILHLMRDNGDDR